MTWILASFTDDRVSHQIKGFFEIKDGGVAWGYAFDAADLSRRLVVEIFADGLAVALLRADLFHDDIRESGLRDGHYGFATTLSPFILASSEIIEARIANTGEAVGDLVRTDGLSSQPQGSVIGEVRWLGGLRLSGSLPRRESFGTEIRAIFEGQVVAKTRAKAWTHWNCGTGALIRPCFDLHLPDDFADGKVHHIEIVADDGTIVSGSPCFVIAFKDGLEAFIEGQIQLESEKMRVRLAEKVLPQSLPFSELDYWLQRFSPPPPPCSDRRSVAVVLIGENGVEPSLASLEQQVTCDVVAACLPVDEIDGRFCPEDLCVFLDNDAQHTDIVVFSLSGVIFFPRALALLAAALDEFPESNSVYCDLCFESDQATAPIGFSAFDYERCLEQGYCCSVFAIRRKLVLPALAKDVDNLFGIFFAQLDSHLSPVAEPIHLPVLLARCAITPPIGAEAALKRTVEAHFEERGDVARVVSRALPGEIGVRILRPCPTERVSIVIATRNQAARAEALVASILTNCSKMALEIIVVDGDSSNPAALAWLDHLHRRGVQALRVPGPFNASRLRNRGAALATGAYLLFLDDALLPSTEGWMEDLLQRLAGPGVGAVGPVIEWPSGILRSAGLILGPGLSVASAFGDRMLGEPGYAGLLRVAHEVSAVPGACLLTRRDLFVRLQGFDDLRFTLGFGDVDYCLRLRSEGYRILMTPDARLTDHSRPGHALSGAVDIKARALREATILRSRWGDVIAADPYYSPWLGWDGPPFSALAWPPRDRRPRQSLRQLPREIPLGL